MARCLVACGSNLGERREHLDRAIELLGFMPGVRVLDVSRYRETRPVGGPLDQPSYLNGACLVETDLGPHELLGLLQSVESSLDRSRTTRWGPRTVDLDLLLYDELVIESERLTLPHPRMATRRFVLEPCAEIAAGLPHPVAGCSVGELLANICEPHPYVAVAGVPGTGTREVATAVADATFSRLVHGPASGMPPDGSAASAWLAAVGAWSRPLESCLCHDDDAGEAGCHDHHGTVSDYWLGSLRLAAERLPDQDRRPFLAAYEAAARKAPRPHVLLLLLAPPEVLAERLAYRSGIAAEASDLFADLAAGSADGSVEVLAERQSRLADELVHGRSLVRNGRNASGRWGSDVPRAVVCIDSGDLGQAVAEAVAAVEAMG